MSFDEPEGNADLFWGAKNLRYGYIDYRGKLVIEPIYKDAHPFKNGFARVRLPDISVNKSGKMRYIDVAGDPASDDYEFVFDISEGLGAVKTNSGKWGYIRLNRADAK